MVNIKPQPGIMKIDLYEGGASELKGQNDVLKLSSNENPFGPSSKAVYAYSISGKSLHRYPSTSHDELRFFLCLHDRRVLFPLALLQHCL